MPQVNSGWGEANANAACYSQQAGEIGEKSVVGLAHDGVEPKGKRSVSEVESATMPSFSNRVEAFAPVVAESASGVVSRPPSDGLSLPRKRRTEGAPSVCPLC